MLAQQVNFFKVSRRDSLGNMMIGVAPMLNAKAKNRHLSEGCSGALRHTILQLCRAGELEPFVMVIQRRFDLIRRQDDRRLHFKFIPSRASYQFKTLDEASVLLCCRIIEVPKSEEKSEKSATKKRKQDHTEVSFRMTIFLFDAVPKEIQCIIYFLLRKILFSTILIIQSLKIIYEVALKLDLFVLSKFEIIMIHCYE